ncbi:hypothetical protein SERLA73DRAFT_166687 [Serpula lacrymans var. lacrymans S7.3]|uniref:DNA replication regulator Sld3 C-terminal domain-containing protein n=2 Tax=Serpula lacrymans var. lacrymans TaxID=341189 RepID=F8PQA5_SERL3|nr:uncharacterized protein SERLADRAFT_447151 [Serpula lacrymans var. lacrymans S7.9]EGO02206.1 hypothetical protein SERLA73DRAFT_166687 [Serpula lacrymans var. lacrymans S7.3]EGO27923.1 hypothetical protein SERLADRAFT_447151 [Serpula lacrymans var. lacrymans S7.9]
MPLHFLIPSLQRVQVASSSEINDCPYPLHALLEPLLLSARSSSSKYHDELPQILANDGGEGEVEEDMMWFALNYEKVDHDEDQTRPNSEDAVMIEEKWRIGWLDRLEKREVQLQILLYLLKLSLPGPSIPLPPVTIHPAPTTSPKKSKHTRVKAKVITPTVEERLESFMDKLSMWQLVDSVSLNEQAQSTRIQQNPTDAYDWMQLFCQDIVEVQFKHLLPEACALLRSKVFPNSPFSDDTSSAASRSPSPSNTSVEPRPFDPHSLGQRYRANPGGPLPDKSSRHTSPSSRQHSDARSRSRSLSISLAQDADARRSGAATSGATIKRALSREISMSRVFKGKKTQEKVIKPTKSQADIRDGGSGPARKLASKRDANQAVTLVAATPVKVKGKRTASRAFGRPSNLLRNTSPSPGMDVFGDDTEIEEIWLPSSSPDVLLLPGIYEDSELEGSHPAVGLGDEREHILAMSTPVKKRIRIS